MSQLRKLSEIMKEMSELLYRQPQAVPSTEAAHMTLFLANMAWNESVGLTAPREGYRQVWGAIEADNPELWQELKSNDIDGMIDELIRYKQAHYPEDKRRILICGIPEGKIHVEWLPAAAPGVDSPWEMRLYGLVRAGAAGQATQFLQQTRNLTRQQAEKKVATIATEMGVV